MRGALNKLQHELGLIPLITGTLVIYFRAGLTQVGTDLMKNYKTIMTLNSQEISGKNSSYIGMIMIYNPLIH